MHDHRPVVRSRSEHCLSRRDIDSGTKRVLYGLADRGHTAYLVGGGVRDLLLGREPKDFDVATDAHPNRIKRIFRNCVLIGRRFRLAHIKFGDKIVETSTFRRQPEMDADPDDPEANLFHRDDNTFGTEEEDARRRDFTINALFYDINTFEVIDHVGGLADLDAGLVRSIGNPDIRFREDPVRMVRAVRFASRLGFRIEPNTYDAILRHHRELDKASPARLLEEVYRLFGFGSAEPAFRLLHDSKIMSVLFPEIAAYLERCARGDPLIWRHLGALDTGSAAGANPTPTLMLGSLFYDPVREYIEDAKADGNQSAYADLVRDALGPAAERFSMPRRIRTDLARCLEAQQRFGSKRGGRFSKARFVGQETFPESLALYEIHIAAANGDPKRLEPWVARYEEFRQSHGRGARKEGKPDGAPRRRRSSRGKRRRKPRSAAKAAR